jgi:hypothetical protein
MADVLEQFFGGGQAVAEPSNKPVNNPGNMRPVGGSGFQKYATPEEGIAAADKNLKIYGEKHGINTLRGVISRWAPPSDNNDTETYINTVAKKVGIDPNQKIDLSDPVQRHVLSGAMFTVEKGAKNLFKTGQQTTQNQTTPTSNDPLEAFFSGKAPKATLMQESEAGGGRGSYAGFNAEQKAIAEGQSNREPRQSEGTAVGRAAGRLLGQIQEGKRALGERMAGAADVLYSPVPAIYGAGVQALARTANTPERAEQIGQAAAASIDKPLGKAFGITGKETYQQPLGGITEPVAKEINRMFNVLGMTPEQISEKTGIPAQDIRNMVVIGSIALPQALKEVAPAVKQAGQAVAKPIREAAAELQVQRPGATPAEAQAQFQAMQGKPGSMGAAAASDNPYLGKISGEERGGSELFPQVKLTKITKDVPVPEQQLRSQLFQEVLPGVQPRPGVVTGNDNLLRNEHALAAMAEPTALGIKMKEQIAKEQVGLSKFAEDRVDATGASRSLINDEQRGQRINDVFHGVDPEDVSGASINGYLNQAKKEIYKSALEKQGNKQISTTHLDSFVNDPLEISTFKAAGQGQLLEGAKELIDMARTTGFKMRDGTVLPPGSVASYDHVRKIFNGPKIWNRDRASFIRDINGAIDQDIAAVADPALYKLGDKIHKLEKDLFKSKGIDKIFGETDQNGVITSATALEKIPQKLNNMPKDQWRHVRDTLNELAQGRIRNAPEGMPPVPKELQDSARAAVAEIDGALAREVYKAGASNVGEWSSKKANNVMNSTIGQKIVETFPPEEVQKFHALNYVGQFTPGLKYEGAALQQRRVGLLEKGLPGIGATAGAAVGGFLGESNPMAIGGGAFVGREIGAKLQAGKAARAETKAVKKMEKEQKKAAELGKQTGVNKIQDLGK